MGDALNFQVDGSFAMRCFSLYLGDGRWLALLFLAGLVLIAWKRSGKPERLLLWGTLLLVLTVYNPLIVRIVVPRLVDPEVYYRLFWLLPMAIGAAYFVVRLMVLCPYKAGKAAIGAAFIACALLVGQPNAFLFANLHRPENIYKVPSALIWACDEIHKDFAQHKDEMKESYKNFPEESTPRVVFAEGLEVFARQYDPGIYLALNRDSRLRYNGSQVVGEAKSKKDTRRTRRILDVLNGKTTVKIEKFKTAMRRKKASYLVIEAGSSCHAYLLEVGCEVIGEGGGYVLYRYIPPKRVKQ